MRFGGDTLLSKPSIIRFLGKGLDFKRLVKCQYRTPRNQCKGNLGAEPQVTQQCSSDYSETSYLGSLH